MSVLKRNNKKILISAYACRPGIGSEPGTGWNVTLAMAKRHQVWVLTQSKYKETINEGIKYIDGLNIEFIYCGLGKTAEFLQKTKITVQLYYYIWQVKAYFIAKKYHHSIRFDLVHHLTYAKYSIPSFLYLLRVPFLSGPVGGGESIPKNFWSAFTVRGKIFEILRLIGRKIGELDPFTRKCMTNADHVIATTNETLTRLKNLGTENASILPAVGISNDDIHRKSGITKVDYNSKIKILMVGILHEWKGFILGLNAFAESNLDNAELWIIGEGSDEKRLRRYSSKLGISDKIKFHRWVSRTELFNILHNTHILLHPSLHESGGNVCVEAMGNRLPVVCLDLGGPSILVPDKAGIKITPSNPITAVKEIAKSLKLLVNDDRIREEMGEYGFNWVVSHFLWDHLADNIDVIYSKILKDDHDS